MRDLRARQLLALAFAPLPPLSLRARFVEELRPPIRPTMLLIGQRRRHRADHDWRH